MDGMHDVLARFDAIEMLIVRVTGLLSVLLVCFLITRHHIESLSKGKRRRRAVDKKEGRSVTEEIK